MDTNKLHPILTKESILKTANASELKHAPQDVLQRYQTYALTHVPLGDTGKQLANLQRVVADNKTCAIGTIVGPYGYGKTSTAVHLWNELRERQIVSVPPFLWVNLQELVDAVYYWVRFEFEQGPAVYIAPLEALYTRYREKGFDHVSDQLDATTARDWFERGLLNLALRPQDVVEFYSDVCGLCEQAGYRGLAVFTDELQATVAGYKPSRDQFFNDLFQIVKDTLGRPGHWSLIISMDDSTEAIIQRMRNDLLQRMQGSALYFRVKDVYNRREYPTELWAAFGERFGFDGSAVIQPEALASIGQIAAREDLGAGPRMVTNALALAVKHFEKKGSPYTPLQVVDDFLEGQVQFDQRGKFPTAVRKTLDNKEVGAVENLQKVIKLLAAFPAGCPEEILTRYNLLESFHDFPPLARRELLVQRSEGYTLRYLLEEDRPPEYIEQRLTQEFVSRYAPGQKYAQMAADGWRQHILLAETFDRNWKTVGKPTEQQIGKTRYQLQRLVGSFDRRYPQRILALAVATTPQSAPPKWEKLDVEADIEIRFELNFGLSASEPSQLLVAPGRPDVAVFQLNLSTVNEATAQTILPDILFEFYSADRLSPLLALALMQYMSDNSGEIPDDQVRVKTVANFLRQYALTILLGENISTNREEFISTMVGHERIKDLFRTQCHLLYPHYKTLIAGPKWEEDLQQYNYALERVASQEGVSVVRGRRPWETTKVEAADTFGIPKRSLTRLETLLDSLSELIVQEEYSGRSPESPIRLRFQLHPLEQQWLTLLDDSEERARHNGIDVPALYAVELLRQSRLFGYTQEELREVLRLLQSRQFVAFDQHRGLLLRAVDAVDDLRAAIQGQLDVLQIDVRQLEEHVAEFETARFPISKLRDQLAAANARDELEILKGELRRYHSNIQSFANSRATLRREAYSNELNTLSRLIQSGVPAWLGNSFPAGPLQTTLEQQRVNYVGAFQSALRDIRGLVVGSNAFLQTLPDSPIETIISLQQELPKLHDESGRLQRRLQSYFDLQSDLEAWRRVIQRASALEQQISGVTTKYATQEWQQAITQLWNNHRRQIEANPMTIPSLHRSMDQACIKLEASLARWLENRREDFERQRLVYERALEAAGLGIRLRIPFDQQNPEESYLALVETVHQQLIRHFDEVQRRLNQLLQKIRYGTQVQEVDMASAEQQAADLLRDAEQLHTSLTPALLRHIEQAQASLLQPLQTMASRENALAETVQSALQKRPPSEDEAELLAMLQSITINREVDLYSLIMRLLDQSEQPVDFSHLMHELQTLFQKNQIGIRVRLL